MGALLGIFFHAVGGFAAGSFYIPYNKVKNWAWEVYWLIGGFFSWIIVPWIVAWLTIPELKAVVHEILHNPDISSNVFWAYFFGMLWGVGGLTFGLTMRYLGMSLGMAIALGFTAAFGTLAPPIFAGNFGALMSTNSGIVTFIGVLVTLAGIYVVGLAGMRKDKELSSDKKTEHIKEFNLRKGILVAIFSGIMSACFAYGLQAGNPIADMSIAQGTKPIFQNTAVLIVVLAGGFTTNFIWCVILMIRNRTAGDIIKKENNPFVSNFIFSALAGATWYFQFMFYGMGAANLGREYDFASWSIHMAFIIAFSNMWGLILKEWSGAGKRTLRTILTGILVLVISTMIIGAGSYIKNKELSAAKGSGDTMVTQVINTDQ